MCAESCEVYKVVVVVVENPVLPSGLQLLLDDQSEDAQNGEDEADHGVSLGS